MRSDTFLLASNTHRPLSGIYAQAGMGTGSRLASMGALLFSEDQARLIRAKVGPLVDPFELASKLTRSTAFSTSLDEVGA